MAMSVLLAYSSSDGHTHAIAQYIQQQLQQKGLCCTVQQASATCAADIQACDVFVLGASVRYGKHHQIAHQLIKQHDALLQTKPSIFFSVNAVARKKGKDTAQGNPYVRKFLQRIAWQPKHVFVFAGKINYPAYNWLDKHIIRFIMRITGGPTDLQGCFEFTNWKAVDVLVQHTIDMVTQHKSS